MKQMKKTAVTGILLLSLLSAAFISSAEKKENHEPSDTSITVIDRKAQLRIFNVYRTPVVIGKDGTFKRAYVPRMHRGKLQKNWIPEYQSPMPEENWRAAGFNDSEWKRSRLPVEKYRGQISGRKLGALHHATPNSIICARAKFLVNDPDRTENLHMSAKFVGGIAVFVNGKEVTRSYLPEGELKEDTLADKYPDDLYITEDGKYLQHIMKRMKNKKRWARRFRYLNDIEIPSSMLRKGINVVAVQIHRAPVNEDATTVTRRHYSGMFRVPGLWAYAGLHELTITAPAGSAVISNTGRPRGIQVWNCPRHATLSVNSYGDLGDPGSPIEIDAVRNGAFSGRFVISSTDTIENLSVSLSSLKAQSGTGELSGNTAVLRCGRRSRPSETQRHAHLFDGLHPTIPERIPALNKRFRIAHRKYVTCKGALLPVWITVKPPKGTPAGLYKGTVTVEADGLEKLNIPVRCTLHGWTLPDPIDYRVRNLNVFSPYSLALHYKVPLWSEEHLKLIEQSFNLMAAINARRVDIDCVPVLRARSAPLEHTMFRLVPKKDGKGYTYDFSIAEKVFDLIEKTMKAPLPLQINCWGDDRKRDKNKKVYRAWAVSNKHVPVLDPEKGNLSSVDNPPPGSEENYKFWKPILDELRTRIKKRGWLSAAALGHQSYCWQPAPAQVDIAHRIWPDAVWNFSAHSGTLNGRFKGTKNLVMITRYSECVWTAGKPRHRGYRRLLKPGRDKSIWNYSARNQHSDNSSLFRLLLKPEDMILRGHDGLGYMCTDFLPIKHPKRKGHYYLLNTKVGNVLGNSTRSFLAAGPDGPVATGRYEMFREGVQICEAILYLQRTLDAKKITGDLAKRVNAYLDSRSQFFLKGWHVNRSQSDRKLFALTAEAAGQIQTGEATTKTDEQKTDTDKKEQGE